MKTAKEKNLKRLMRARRSRAKVNGTAEKPRLSIFRSNRFVYAQLIDDVKSHTLAAATAKKGEAVGTDLAAQAIKLGINKAVFEKGAYKYHGRIRAVAEAARKAGLNI